ncbi:MAG: Exo-beta-D-glucosaminidase precursor [Candidatus Heimdallarchaeota archaeon LC_3]|nr:MAG: Exo-beta-D-glucosaminidase precursor [Candidatus Heimdallarchaeota archaeon LC_3]
MIEGKNEINFVLTLEDPKLWWPNGYGDQNLYDLTVKISENSVTKKIGFRYLEVITEDDKFGRSMTFRVNGRDIFCKGANWIPIDALPFQQTDDKYQRLLSDVIDANMNMIRVWGGGQYEKDVFYNLCDEKGILVWQDFMFGGALYPTDDQFLANVEQEVIHQVKRLKDHPCIAIWCGDNELIGALNWFEVTKRNRARYLNDYIKLNTHISTLVKKLDPDRKWWPSSPCGGEGDFSDNWQDDTKGDMHYWNVWHEGKPFKAYYDVTPRFCSEFGFQSFPSIETVKNYAPQDQWKIDSPIMKHHQKNQKGNEIIYENFTRYFKVPTSFENIIYLSQVQQAIAIKTAVDYWRSQRPQCMGTLYWQLNDNWPVASWSSIEYSGKWKLLHYFVKRFFQPIHIVAYCKNETTIEIWGINDTNKNYEGEVEFLFIDYFGKVVKKNKILIELIADTSINISKFEEKELPFDRKKGFLHITASLFSKMLIETDFLFSSPKDSEFKIPTISSEVNLDSDRNFSIVLKTDKPVFYLTLEISDIKGNFSDNCITLLPNQLKTIYFFPEDDVTQDQVKNNLKLFNINDYS